MIPENITKSDVLEAIDEIDRNGIPARRNSRDYHLLYNKNRYPPKYVISLANKHANGQMLSSGLFSGGTETNSFLQSLGFEITGGEPVSMPVSERPSMKHLSSEWQVIIKQDTTPDIGRIIIQDGWHDSYNDKFVAVEEINADAKEVLRTICDVFPQKLKIKYLMTCGGFIHFSWSLSDRDYDCKNPPSQITDYLISVAENKCKVIFDSKLRKRLLKITDFITLGVDSYQDGPYTGTAPHIELVSVLDLSKNKYYWTGKSYPTPKQAGTLVRINDFDSHFTYLNGDKVLLLGCHDMTMFNPRSHSNAKGWRKDTTQTFYSLIQKNRPSIVLHHPHSSDTYRTWIQAKNKLLRDFSFIKKYANAGKYFNWRYPCRAKLDTVLLKMKNCDTIDFVVKRRNN